MILRLTLFLSLVVFTLNIYPQTLYINEFMSSNSSTIADEDGEYPDWIELYNASNESMSLQGYYLSDKDTNLQRWQFAEGEIGANGFLTIFASGKNRQMETSFWNTVINWGDTWKYMIPDSEPATNWTTHQYDDAGWLDGETGIGYGDDDDNTLIDPTISLYARKKFTVEDLNNVLSAALHIDFDDAFVAYLNGVEIARENIGTPGEPPPFDESAIGDGFEAKIFQGGYPNRYNIPDLKTILVEGENVLAVQVHNLGEKRYTP